MSNAIDQRMSKYVNIDTKEVVTMMATSEKVGEKYVRKDVYDKLPPPSSVKVEPPAKAK